MIEFNGPVMALSLSSEIIAYSFGTISPSELTAFKLSAFILSFLVLSILFFQFQLLLVLYSLSFTFCFLFSSMYIYTRGHPSHPKRRVWRMERSIFRILFPSIRKKGVEGKGMEEGGRG